MIVLRQLEAFRSLCAKMFGRQDTKLVEVTLLEAVLLSISRVLTHHGPVG